MATEPDTPAAVAGFPHGPPLHFLVVGDLMLDRYVRGEARRLSPEAPVPVLRRTQLHTLLGGAGNVAANLAALGATVSLCAVVGDDADGAQVRALCDSAGIDARGVVALPGRPTTRKERVVAGVQQLLRIDEECALPLAAAEQAALIPHIAAACRRQAGGPATAAVLLSDYCKGVLTPGVIAAAMDAAAAAGCPVWVDPKGDGWRRYRGAYALTPNLQELAHATGRPLGPGACPRDIAAAARAAGRLAGAAAMVVTCGPRGMLVWQEDQRTPPVMEAAPAQRVFDVTGAGDTVVAALAWSTAHGLPLPAAARLATLAAGLAVAGLGTTAVARADLERAHRASTASPTRPAAALPHACGRGAISWAEAEALCLAARAAGRRVVFANGCFDLLHAGHLTLLEAARARGDLLVVGLNADSQVAAQKGAGRPVVPFEDRARLLAALSIVDMVVGFATPTPLELIAALQPAVLVKGADWRGREVAGADLVRGWGGELALIELAPGRSTTQLVARAQGGGGRPQARQAACSAAQLEA